MNIIITLVVFNTLVNLCILYFFIKKRIGFEWRATFWNEIKYGFDIWFWDEERYTAKSIFGFDFINEDFISKKDEEIFEKKKER